MGFQKEIARQIQSKGADYVLAVKGNQGNLHAELKIFLSKRFRRILSISNMIGLRVTRKLKVVRRKSTLRYIEHRLVTDEKKMNGMKIDYCLISYREHATSPLHWTIATATGSM